MLSDRSQTQNPGHRDPIYMHVQRNPVRQEVGEWLPEAGGESGAACGEENILDLNNAGGCTAL